MMIICRDAKGRPGKIWIYAGHSNLMRIRSDRTSGRRGLNMYENQVWGPGCAKADESRADGTPIREPLSI